jgi:DNA-binding HxlR family transcriptional regulator
MRKTSSTNFQNQAYLEEKCALNELIYLLSKRWITEVLFSIEAGNVRFSSLKEDLRYISDNILADRLKLLEQHKLITRNDHGPDVSSRIEYSLTESGYQLSDQLDVLCKFATGNVYFPSKAVALTE